MNQIPARALQSPVAIHCTVMATSWIESYKAVGSYKTMLQKRNTALAAQTSQEGRSWRHLLFFYLFAFFFHFSHLFFCLFALHCIHCVPFSERQTSRFVWMTEWAGLHGLLWLPGRAEGSLARDVIAPTDRTKTLHRDFRTMGFCALVLWPGRMGERNMSSNINKILPLPD